MLKNFRVATHNVQARLDINASCTYVTANKIHLLHTTEPYPQQYSPTARTLPHLHRQATSLGYTLILTTHSAFLYDTAALHPTVKSTTSTMDGRIHTLTISQSPHPAIRFVGIYAHAKTAAHKPTP